MTTTSSWNKLLSCVALPLALIALPACGGPSVEDVCDKACECEQCSESQRSRCVAEGNAIENTAEDTDCEDPFDDYVECSYEEGQCRDAEFEAEDRCGDIEQTLAACGIDL